MPTQPALPLKRLFRLDLLRGVAVVLVIGRHFPPEIPAALPAVLRFALALWIRVGWVGVDLFFVLSGFLVSSLLFQDHLRTGTIDVKRFLIRRGLKIYPAFYVLIIVTVICLRLLGFPINLRGLLAEIFFVQNYRAGIWNHTWSLAVEEHFYLFLAALFFILVRSRRKEPFSSLPALFGVIALACFTLRLSVSLGSPYTHQQHLFPTHLRIDSLFCGVFLSYGYWFRQGWYQALVKWRTPLAIAAALVLAWCCHFEVEDFFMHTAGLTILYLCFGAILIHAVTAAGPAQARGRLARSVAHLGRFSYSIYLWHLFVLGAALTSFPGAMANKWGYLMLCGGYLVVSLGAGVLMSKLVELPVLLLRDRWFPGRSAALPLAAPGSG